jgi:hypothetical protein
MAPHGNQRGFQPLKCSVCGSVWFREATFLASDYPQSRLHAPLAVCLCGTPDTPQLSGIRPSDDQVVIDRLFGALATDRSLRQAIAAVLPDVSASATLAGQIARLESTGELLRRRLLPASTAVAPPKPPSRVAATHGLDAIALELQRAGLLNFRQARQAVWAVRDLWKAALAQGESVETPLGVLSIRQTLSGRRHVVLKASSGLHFEAAPEVNRPSAPGTNTKDPTTTGAAQPKSSAQNEVRNMPLTPNAASSVQCPRCGSHWFAEHTFLQYADQFYSSAVGGSLSPLPADPQLASVCLCGMLFPPKRWLREYRFMPDKRSFFESWEKAQKYQRLQNEAEERTRERLRGAVNPEYIQQLSARIQAAETLIADLSAELKGRHLKPRRRTK